MCAHTSGVSRAVQLRSKLAANACLIRRESRLSTQGAQPFSRTRPSHPRHPKLVKQIDICSIKHISPLQWLSSPDSMCSENVPGLTRESNQSGSPSRAAAFTGAIRQR